MPKVEYTNKSLAEDYFKVATEGAFNCQIYRCIKKRISDFNVNISHFFNEHGNLNNLSIKGVGLRSKFVLESILTHGVESTKKTIRSEREKIRSKEEDYLPFGQGHIYRKDGKIPNLSVNLNDENPSFERAIKKYDDD